MQEGHWSAMPFPAGQYERKNMNTQASCSMHHAADSGSEKSPYAMQSTQTH